VVAKVRESLAVSNQAALKFDGERFNLKKLKSWRLRKNIRLKTKQVCSFGELK